MGADMKRIALVGAIGLVLVAALSLAGCASSTSTSPIELTAADSGSARQIAVGQQLQIALESNPTTGYQWTVDGAIPPQLELVGEPKYTAGSTGAVGAGGIQGWTFAGKTAGECVLKLKYSRSFEPGVAPAKTFSVTVTVR
jgi:inhibitor of cysteine peptidase